MKDTMKKAVHILLVFLLIIIGLNLLSAMVVNSVDADKIYPGQTGSVKISVENTLSDDVEDVSLALVLANTAFSTEGSSEKSVDAIDSDDEESFSFVIKSASSTKPGDYNIPYTLTYYVEAYNGTMIPSVKTGTFGVTVVAKTELEYDTVTENNILNQKGKTSVKITNKGLGDIGFVSVKIISSSGLEVIGSNNQYIGTVRSDDSETASFDVIYKAESAQITAEITYKDSENNDNSQTVVLPVKVYTPEKALELGLIQKNYTWIYVLVIVVLIVLYIIYRRIKKAKKKNGLK